MSDERTPTEPGGDPARAAGSTPPPGYGPPQGYGPPPGYSSGGYAQSGYSQPGYGYGYGPGDPGAPGAGAGGFAAGHQGYSWGESRGEAVLVHVLSIFFGFWAALIGYLVIRDRGPFSRQHSAAALSWQLSVIIYGIVIGLVIVLGIPLSLVGVGLVMLIAAWAAVCVMAVLNLVFCIMAAVRANQGLPYRYPLAIPFIR